MACAASGTPQGARVARACGPVCRAAALSTEMRAASASKFAGAKKTTRESSRRVSASCRASLPRAA
eukprot:789366-Alexandrium_andersonii.AAC.1